VFIYIDTTENFVLGLLDQNFEWVEYFENDKTKISAEIHHYINEFLNKNSIEIKEISGLIYPAGPGSYTGMRVAEGISQIFNWQEIPSFSFYHFEVPQILGNLEGRWLAKAFKGEIFEYSWNGEETSKKLKRVEEYIFEGAKSYFSRSESMIMNINHQNFIYTKDLIKNNSSKFFNWIVSQNYKSELYYFRELEQEFSRS
jgi:tRNA threonylcarbamoyladenosine biosynthesis protein TsaB